MLWCRAGAATGALGGAPHGATMRVRGMPEWARWCHAGADTGALGEAPDGATKRVRGMPKVARWCHASAAGALGGAPLWGHETREGCADMGTVLQCEHNH
eukprot:3918483-Pyramimonas_sp.AAC.1